ncbi:glycoside hydrolase family 3 protein [Microbacterium sp. M28]|uniref:glycoside hydrolase family 3 N-terminal domain-containing protein n=1 Tax=Microbacterium sp. M28 TaxID=2962064 RepID=UPI0021F493AE|nr:glycoside hydrolase family 3 N-terminal domain-containing protein [Microbacterium sp. M28]UYO96013.1 glycoside hydrolase family 3 protein [Microbacterium sp. M28]
MTISRRRLLSVAVLVSLGLGLAACAPDAQPSPNASAPPSATSTPTPSPTPRTPLEQAAERVDRMPLRERAALIVMGYAAGTDSAALSAYAAGGPRGLILMGNNVPGAPEQLRALTDAVHATSADALIATDQEGGAVARVPWDQLPSARTLKSEEPAAAQTAFAARAQLLDDAGIDINFGVVADVPRSDGSFIHSRSYGTDAQAVADRVAAIVAGERGRVATTLKHFPGHGAAEGDSHHSIPTTGMGLAEWRTVDALPFRAGIDAGAELVMMGHLRFTEVSPLPATLSPEWYGVLRDELGFEGVAVTDDLGMLLSSGDPAYADPVANAVTAVAAGADMVLTIAGSTPETAGLIIDALVVRAESDPRFAARVSEAAARVAALADAART